MKLCLIKSNLIKNQLIKREVYKKDHLVDKGNTHQFLSRRFDSFNVFYSKALIGKEKTYGFLPGLCLYKGKFYNGKKSFFGVKKDTTRVIKYKHGENNIVSECLEPDTIQICQWIRFFRNQLITIMLLTLNALQQSNSIIGLKPKLPHRTNQQVPFSTQTY